MNTNSIFSNDSNSVCRPYEKASRSLRSLTVSLAAVFLYLALSASMQAATFTVTKTADTNDGICNSDCSLREAVVAANNAMSDDVIEFDLGIFGTAQTIRLNGSELVFFNSGRLTINGTGANLLTLSANDASRVFFNEGANLTINNLTMTGGNGTGSNSGAGGAIFNAFGGILTLNNTTVTDNSANRAGGIYNVARCTLILNNSIVSGNTSGFGGGGVYNSGSLTVSNSLITGNDGGSTGGGLLNTGATLFDPAATADINNSTISNNTVEGGGGGISNEGTINLTNSTISGNSAESSAGGIASRGSQIVFNITNSTISNNSTAGAGGGVYLFETTLNLAYTTIADNISDADRNGTGSGGGINSASNATVNARNTIIARNTDHSAAAPDFFGTLASQGYNLIENTLNLTVNGTTTGNILGRDALLLPLGSYGGTTRTHALQPNSPAIDAAAPDNIPAADQRGFTRPADGDLNGSVLPDIGAYERQLATFKVTKTTDTDDNVCDADCSLREAFAAANAGGASTVEKAIIFDPTLFGSAQTIALTLGELKINGSAIFSISGPGADLLTISGGEQSRILFINPGAAVTLSRIRLSGGSGAGMFSGSGGAVYNNAAALTITDSVFHANQASFAAGAIYNNSGTLNISGSIVSGNMADNIGGGVQNAGGGTMNVNDSTFTGNSAQNGGGIQNAGGTLTIDDSFFTDNTAGSGGGIYNLSNGTLTIKDSTFSGNTANISGGGIKSAGTLSVTGSVISNNSAPGAGSGGGIGVDQTADINNSIIANNRAGFRGGGVDNNGTLSLRDSSVTGNASNNLGGGIGNTGVLNIAYSCIDGNSATQAGGGIGNFGSMVVALSTVSGNSASGGFGGGGIFHEQASGFSYIVNATVAKNKANFAGGGVNNNSGSLVVRNSIIGDNSSGSGSAPDFSGALTSQGYNLIENAAGASITGTTTGNIIGRDPRLLPLRNNGGATLTHALRITSPALDKGNNFGDIYDQRRFPRTYNNPNVPNANNGTDIGAFEAGASDLTPAENFDFDGDGKADISVFRPADGTWYLNRSAAGFAAARFGISTDKLTPADFDGDGLTDIAVFREGVWHLQRSASGFTSVQFGAPGDVPAPADFDGDGRAELAVFRPGSGTWFALNLFDNQFSSVQFGTGEDKPVAADYDGDGRADHAVFRPSNGTWYLLRSQQGFTALQFGLASDKPVPADYDGDGRTDPAVYRDGTWYLLRSSEGFTGVQFGLATDLPSPADYDGDGRADLAVFREGSWYLQRSVQGFASVQFGAANDKPVPAAFVR